MTESVIAWTSNSTAEVTLICVDTYERAVAVAAWRGLRAGEWIWAGPGRPEIEARVKGAFL